MNSDTRKFSLFPKTLSACVDPLTRTLFKSRGLANVRLLSEWPNVVGTKLAENSLPEKITFPPGKTVDGTLTIAVAGGFATEIQHMQLVILERINTYYGYKAVARIVLSHSFSAPKPKAEPAKPLPRSIDAACTDSIEDPELQSALKSLAKTLAGSNS